MRSYCHIPARLLTSTKIVSYFIIALGENALKILLSRSPRLDFKARLVLAVRMLAQSAVATSKSDI